MKHFPMTEKDEDFVEKQLNQDIDLDDVPNLQLHMLDSNIQDKWELYRTKPITAKEDKEKLGKTYEDATTNVRICLVCDGVFCGPGRGKKECFRHWNKHCGNNSD